MQPVTEWPIDPHALNKGDWIPADTIENITGVKRAEYKRYQLALLRAKSMIEQTLASVGRNWTLRIQGQTLRVLTDAEASSYNEEASDAARRRIERCAVRLCGVETSGLTPEERKQHDRRMLKLAMRQRMLREADRRAAIKFRDNSHAKRMIEGGDSHD